MSAQQVETVTTETRRKRPRLWHAPADREQFVRASGGEPWVARCGKRVKRTAPGTAPRKAWELSPMEPCVVCVGLRAPAP